MATPAHGTTASGVPLLLRPVRAADLPLLALWLDADVGEPLLFYGFRDAAALQRDLDRDGMLGDDSGRLVVQVDGQPAGSVSWITVRHGPSSSCWAFTREGILRGSQWRAGAWRDDVLYSRLRGE